ncbi:pantoate--beta-alanine ligase, partial [Fulvivirga lutimaris]|uniref:pantoate--beta-alanine ligase n=1 Tax=Fulvivirga lutimaris TaxID=1819566 RepID=UPI0012BCCCD0
MQIFRDISSLQLSLNELKLERKTIGLVPTMGALHDGHAALLKASLAENDVTVCSIFVNPTQFNNDEDLKNYPRTYEEDIEFLKSFECDIVFNPSAEEMYPKSPSLKFNFADLEQSMEGSYRPGHFNGVAIVVSKLFNIVNPDRAYFGQKDLQQYRIISQLVEDLSYNIELRQIPIKRDENGLALSSRNKRLSTSGLKSARK